ncbi:MAG: hypothetical protein IKR19_08215 [Acholeplasmatales bacterium]|nr:hypothetical protein [Acholeplasmatales bacterium]
MIQNREYLFSTDSFNRPVTVERESAVGVRLLELLMMDPGSNPLHPNMGVGIRNYRYGINTLSDLENRIRDQIKTYLPMYQVDDLVLVQTPDKILNIEIRIEGNTYRFNSEDTDNPIRLSDIDNA